MHKKVLQSRFFQLNKTIYFLEPVFFVKNRKPYDDYEAKLWFKEALHLESAKVILTKHYHFMKSLLKDARMLH